MAEITKIKVGSHLIGIRDLQVVLKEITREFHDQADDVIKDELLKRLSKFNYIPDAAKNDYRQAFWREYQKCIGISTSHEEQDADILILRAGCFRCEKLVRV